MYLNSYKTYIVSILNRYAKSLLSGFHLHKASRFCNLQMIQSNYFIFGQKKKKEKKKG